MKKILILLLLTFSAGSAFSQNKPDFSGEWELDIQKSKLDARARIESMTMRVTQSDEDIRIETFVKRQRISDQSRDGEGRGMGRFGSGFGMIGDTSYTYKLNGKETEVTQETPMGAIPVLLKARVEKGKLKLNQTRILNTPMGQVYITVKETWQISEDGKSLAVKREIENPMGVNSSEMVFVKKN